MKGQTFRPAPVLLVEDNEDDIELSMNVDKRQNISGRN